MQSRILKIRRKLCLLDQSLSLMRKKANLRMTVSVRSFLSNFKRTISQNWFRMKMGSQRMKMGSQCMTSWISCTCIMRASKGP